MRLLSLCFVVSLFASCASQSRATYAPLATIRDVEVTYRAELAPASTQPDPVCPSAEVAANAPLVAIRARFMRFEPRLERELFGPGRIDGRVLERTTLDSVCLECVDAGTLVLLSAPSLHVGVGGRGSCAVTQARPFVRAFEFTGSGLSFIGDPQLSLVQEGLVLDSRPRVGAADGSLEFDVELQANYLARPLHQYDVQVPGLSSEVTLQLPLAYEQRLSTQGALAAGEVLVLRGLVDAQGRSIVACLEGELVAPHAAAAPGGADTGRLVAVAP